MQTVLEALETGNTTLLEVSEQGEKIRGISQKIDDADSFLVKSSKVLRTMGRRMIANKAMMIGIIVILLAIIFLVVYLKWLKPRGGGTSSSGSGSGSGSGRNATSSNFH